jgi:hypothetical protein
VRQLRETALREERRPVVVVVGILEEIVAPLWRENLVVVLVDGGLPCRAVGHRRDWDPARAQSPRPGASKVGRRLVQGARLPLGGRSHLPCGLWVPSRRRGRMWLVWQRWKLCAAA